MKSARGFAVPVIIAIIGVFVAGGFLTWKMNLSERAGTHDHSSTTTPTSDDSIPSTEHREQILTISTTTRNAGDISITFEKCLESERRLCFGDGSNGRYGCENKTSYSICNLASRSCYPGYKVSIGLGDQSDYYATATLEPPACNETGYKEVDNLLNQWAQSEVTRISVEENRKTYSYETITYTLTGTVILESHYGPPGFGESPETDRKEEVPILKLDAPISVKGNIETPNVDSFSGVQRMQLVGKSSLGLQTFAGKRARATGTLFEKQNGEHYTDVLMLVQTIQTTLETL